MISGQEIREGRERARMTQAELGQVVGVSARTVGNWERGETVPRNREGALREAITGGPRATPALDQASDAELLAEVARRMGPRVSTVTDVRGLSSRPPEPEPPGHHDSDR